jgi:hypothetical protein
MTTTTPEQQILLFTHAEQAMIEFAANFPDVIK